MCVNFKNLWKWSNWCENDPIGSKMIQLVQKLSKWFKNDPIGSKMIQVVQKSSNWFKNDPIGSEKDWVFPTNGKSLNWFVWFIWYRNLKTWSPGQKSKAGNPDPDMGCGNECTSGAVSDPSNRVVSVVIFSSFFGQNSQIIISLF